LVIAGIKITQKDLLCLKCTLLPDCDENHPDCLYKKASGRTHKGEAQRRWYLKKKKDPVWLAAQKEKWRKKYKEKSKNPEWMEKQRQRQYQNYWKNKTKEQHVGV